MAQVVLANLSKAFKGTRGEDIHAVRDASLTVEDGEFVVLVGPSGCGKSTTLRMIAGLEEITSGTISIDGRVVNQHPPKDRDVAMVFQNYALYPHMTVFENMAFGLKLRKVPKAEIQIQVRAVAETLGLTPCLDRKPKMLSGGQQQRVALGRAIVRKPKVFLFDEPLSNRDAQMRVQMRAELARLHHRLSATMIYVTHDQVEAMTMGDRIVVMNEGRMQQVDAPIQLYNQPANRFVAGFIGSPPMNFFTGTITSKHQHLCFAELATSRTPSPHALSLELPSDFKTRLEGHVGKVIVMGLRPEDFAGSEKTNSSETRISATVEVIEPMGAETFVYLNNGVTSFVVRVPAHFAARVDQELSFTPNLERAHFFHPDTGEAVV